MELEIIAHRGYSAIAPENTMAAFYAAIQHQADSIEFDVQLSADGVPVIIHDATLDRTTNGTGKVIETTLKQLKELDAGSWFNPVFAKEKIPTFQELLSSIKSAKTQNLPNLKKLIYAEVKQADFWATTNIEKFLKIIIEKKSETQCIVACFNHNFLEKVRKYHPTIKLGYLVASVEEYTEKLPKAAADGNAMMLSQYNILLNYPCLVQDTINMGVEVGVWTVDKQEEFQQLTNLGIQRIVTNSLINRLAQVKI
ncbi:glycerophosphoryl diester phosphodiesterase [Crinalium epipsammum PCC 9333]|uniref:Glycerophosphoryl diester phosphodiesterase n=1 Tax=Crinalium epipsammum PCC 9333 TaxID=1173022 RepID=K9W4B7_9CYAN|nr:glycerophosphodiester phosphodiesterase family protein [Crinalium epipsammum]AFZ14582.1 glycerophosphoryl diester phosphodiesterase [Crinalium epipsammum PCC 9333]